MQEIIVDYVHEDLLKLMALMANAFYCFVMALACIYAILKLSFGV
jgi:succinate dehydrogenase / fumarate reductase, membrane anchor subunit